MRIVKRFLIRKIIFILMKKTCFDNYIYYFKNYISDF